MRCYFARTISFVDDFFKTYLDRQNRLSGDKDSPSLRENFIRNFLGEALYRYGVCFQGWLYLEIDIYCRYRLVRAQY